MTRKGMYDPGNLNSEIYYKNVFYRLDINGILTDSLTIAVRREAFLSQITGINMSAIHILLQAAGTVHSCNVLGPES